MQSVPILPYKFNTNQNVMLPYSKLRSNIDIIKNSAAIDIQNAIRNKIAKTKVKSMIKNRENEYQNARNATIKNMQNTIMAQGVINDLIDTVVNQSNKNKAATKIQNVFKNKKIISFFK